MPALSINDIDFPIARKGASVADDNVETAERMQNGEMFLEQRFIKRRFTLLTNHYDEDEARGLRQLLRGVGHTWSFDADEFSSKGLGILAGTFTTPAASGMFDGYLSVTVAVTFATPNAGVPGTPVYTVGYWRDEDAGAGFDWHQITITQDSTATVRKWRDGVRNDGLATPEFSIAVISGNISFDVGNFDDIVWLPWSIPDRFGDEWPQATPFSFLPFLDVDGDLIEGGPGVFLGRFGGMETVPTINGRTYIVTFELLER